MCDWFNRKYWSGQLRYNAIASEMIDTQMTRSINEKRRNTITVQIPLKRFGDINQVAKTAIFWHKIIILQGKSSLLMAVLLCSMKARNDKSSNYGKGGFNTNW